MHQQGVENKVEQAGLKPEPTWNTGISGGNLTHYTTFFVLTFIDFKSQRWRGTERSPIPNTTPQIPGPVQPVLDQAKARESRASSGLPCGWQELKLGSFSPALSKLLAESWTVSRAADTQINANMGCQHHKLWLYQLHYKDDTQNILNRVSKLCHFQMSYFFYWKA